LKVVKYCPSVARYEVGPAPPRVSVFGYVAEEICGSLSVMGVWAVVFNFWGVLGCFVLCCDRVDSLEIASGIVGVGILVVWVSDSQMY